MIFVSVAAYRDPDLPATIQSCLQQADNPDALRFCICWQHGPAEELPDWLRGPQFTVLDIPFERSLGACWARAMNMDLWDGEEWYLQLDSHHRFAAGWDTALLEQAAATESDRPVVSTYCPPFADDFPASTRATAIVLRECAPSGDVLLGARWLDLDITRPIRARFLSAHFLFAPGSFVENVPYDPELYFLGEEITLTVRAFTHGYDLFHPGVPIASHDYTRAGRPKHWEDHRAAHGIAVEWHERDAISRTKVERLLSQPWEGRFGLGARRSLADYEAYAGIKFCPRRIQRSVRDGSEPPGRPDEEWIAADEGSVAAGTVAG